MQIGLSFLAQLPSMNKYQAKQQQQTSMSSLKPLQQDTVSFRGEREDYFRKTLLDYVNTEYQDSGDSESIVAALDADKTHPLVAQTLKDAAKVINTISNAESKNDKTDTLRIIKENLEKPKTQQPNEKSLKLLEILSTEKRKNLLQIVDADTLNNMTGMKGRRIDSHRLVRNIPYEKLSKISDVITGEEFKKIFNIDSLASSVEDLEDSGGWIGPDKNSLKIWALFEPEEICNKVLHGMTYPRPGFLRRTLEGDSCKNALTNDRCEDYKVGLESFKLALTKMPEYKQKTYANNISMELLKALENARLNGDSHAYNSYYRPFNPKDPNPPEISNESDTIEFIQNNFIQYIDPEEKEKVNNYIIKVQKTPKKPL